MRRPRNDEDLLPSGAPLVALVGLVLSAWLAADAGAAPPPRPTAADIARWIKELGDNDFTTREKASRKLWAAAVTEAGSLDQDQVIAALDRASIPEGPGGPAEMVPGQHHVRMNMYIAQARNGTFKIVENLGVIDPKEATVADSRTSRRRAVG